MPPEQQKTLDTRQPRLVAFGTRISPHLLKDLKLAALEDGITVQQVTERALRAWLAAHGHQPGEPGVTLASESGSGGFWGRAGSLVSGRRGFDKLRRAGLKLKDPS